MVEANHILMGFAIKTDSMHFFKDDFHVFESLFPQFEYSIFSKFWKKSEKLYSLFKYNLYFRNSFTLI